MDKVRSLHEEGSKEAQSIFDILFPKALRMQASLSDTEANLLYRLWKNAPAGTNKFAVSEEADLKTMSALKGKGYLAGFGSSLEFTDKGKKIIVEMVTHQPNAFDKRATEVSYSSIKAKASTRPKQSLVKKTMKSAGVIENDSAVAWVQRHCKFAKNGK